MVVFTRPPVCPPPLEQLPWMSPLEAECCNFSSPETFPPKQPCLWRSCNGNRSVAVPLVPLRDPQFLCRAPCGSLGSSGLEGLNPCKEKKAVASSKKKKATANELLLIGRSSIRETLHYLLTRCCVLKGRTIITNWTWGIGGVCCCRGERCPWNVYASVSLCWAVLRERESWCPLEFCHRHYGKVWRDTEPTLVSSRDIHLVI